MPRISIVPAAHSLLKRATNRLHRRIDRESVLTVLMLPGVTLDLYSAAMRCLERAYRQIDRLLVEHDDLCPPELPAYVPRVPSIHRDLIALQAFHGGAYTSFRLHPPDCRAAYLGMRYVVEGAQLGSRVIYGHLFDAFGDDLREFGSFWTPGSAMQLSWPAVLRSLAEVDSRGGLAAAAGAARRTFEHMARYVSVKEMDGK